MKKVFLGIMVFGIAFSSMAQTPDATSPDQNKMHQGQRHFKKDEFLKELNLTADQKAQVKTENQSFKQQMNDLKQANLSADEQKTKWHELAKNHREKIASILTPEQRKQAADAKKQFGADKHGRHDERFEQLTKNLNLTTDQSAQIATLNTGLQSNIKNIKQNATLSQDQKRAQIKDLMKKHRSDVEALLTQDQKTQLKNNWKNRPAHNAAK